MDDALQESPDPIDLEAGDRSKPIAPGRDPTTPGLVPPVAPDSGSTSPAGPPAPIEASAIVPHRSGGFEQWSVLALVTSLVGAIPITWPVPILSLMAVGFGLVGVRNCQITSSFRNRWMAALGVAIALATLIAAVALTALKHLQFLPFWTTSSAGVS